MKTADRARYAAVRDAAKAALARGIGGRWELPGGGLLVLERPLPFLLIGRLDDPSAAALSGGVASRLLATADPAHAHAVGALAHDLVTTLAHDTHAMLVLWLGTEPAGEAAAAPTVRLSPDPRWDSLVTPLAQAFAELRLDGSALVHLARARPTRGGLSLPPKLARKVCEIEIEVPAVYRDAATGALRPMWLLDVARSLATALAAASDAFVDRCLPRVSPKPRLGASTLDPAAQEADRVLCGADDAFEMLIQLTPANLDAIWARLVETDFGEEPVLRYRPLPFDPMLVKRRVFEAPVEEVDDPLVADLLREKQEELDRMLSLLRDRGETFLHESEQLYGRADDELLALAESILTLPVTSDSAKPELALDAILERTRGHMLRYQDEEPFFPDEIELRDDMAAGLMVSRGRLLMRSNLSLSASRLDALLEHEVGTHVLTWFNGSAQPLRLLGRGLAGYEALQEGLAVLAEHLAGALDPTRLRVLAARVVAACAASSGASFLEVFHRLHRDHHLSRAAAFQTTVRALRGGGMTKDLVYLRGLCDLAAHLQAGGALAPLYTGKIALAHVPRVAQLEDRGLLAPPRVLPLVLREAGTEAKVAAIRSAGDPARAVLHLAGGGDS